VEDRPEPEHVLADKRARLRFVWVDRELRRRWLLGGHRRSEHERTVGRDTFRRHVEHHGHSDPGIHRQQS
jgi:hypothetical protein